jgi:hypothetical protein
MVLTVAATQPGWTRGGCFVPGTPILRADRSSVAIERVRPGEALLAFTAEGAVVSTTVRSVIIHDVDEYVVVVTERRTVRASAEHPFYVGAGTFKPVEALRVGDCIYAFDVEGLRPERIVRLERVHGPVQVFNLQTDAPHTFFAGGAAVHNKGGRGGAGGKSGAGARAGRGNRRPLGPKSEPVPEEEVDEGLDEEPEEEGGEWPVWLWPALAGAGLIGAGLLAWGVYRRRRVVAKPAPVAVAMGPEIAAGVQRHVAATVLSDRAVAIGLDSLPRPAAVLLRAKETQELLDALGRLDPTMNCEDLRMVARSTFTLLQYYWQEHDYEPMQALVTPKLYAHHRDLLQEKARNGESYRIDHLRVNAVDIVQLHYVPRLGERAFTAFITATAQNYHVAPRTAGAPGQVPRLHGDRGPVGFQEFWTFERHANTWLLSALEPGWKPEPLEMTGGVELPVPIPPPQVDITTAAAEERNGAVREVAEAAATHAIAGTADQAPIPLSTPEVLAEAPVAVPVPEVVEEAPALPPVPQAPQEAPPTRSERLLEELAQTWDRARLKERARQVFFHVLRSREMGELTAVKDDELFPSVAAAILEVIDKDRQEGVVPEYRHLAVRSVELIAVRHFPDSADGLFTACIRAQAQNVIRRHGQETTVDPEVVAFEQYWMFGRLDGEWRLKGVLTPEQGRQLLAQEEASEDGEVDRPAADWGRQGEPERTSAGAETDERVASSAVE